MWNNLVVWLENTALSDAVSGSAWLYPAVEIIHIFGFSVLVGAAIMYDLRLLGVSKRIRVTDATRHLSLWSRLSLILVLPSGLILFMVAATALSQNFAFQLKIILLVIAGINAAIFHLFTLKAVESWNQHKSSPLAARTAACLSIILWVSIITCGRLIAYI